jgi:hypothetical protein
MPFYLFAFNSPFSQIMHAPDAPGIELPDMDISGIASGAQQTAELTVSPI